MKKNQIFKGNQGGLNHQCVAYKIITINNKKYVAIIDEIIKNTINMFADPYIYYCSMFDEKDNLKFHRMIEGKTDKDYLSVIETLCKEYISIQHLHYGFGIFDEQNALEELEQWDGVFNIK